MLQYTREQENCLTSGFCGAATKLSLSFFLSLSRWHEKKIKERKKEKKKEFNSYEKSERRKNSVSAAAHALLKFYCVKEFSTEIP
jgi:lipid A disaccharide synthetase